MDLSTSNQTDKNEEHDEWDQWEEPAASPSTPFPPSPPQSEVKEACDQAIHTPATPQIEQTPPCVSQELQVEETRRRLQERELELTLDFEAQLTQYLHNLADPSVRNEVNTMLATRKFKNLEQYYEERPELVDYTVESEVSRMHYEVIPANATSDTDRITETEEVKACLLRHKWSLSVRYANQSIFADLLSALQNRFLRPDLNIAIISRDSSFQLDFRTELVFAESEFQISTLSYDMKVRELALVKGSVRVDLKERILEQKIGMPTMRMIFDDDIRATAKVLAQNEVLMEEDGMSPTKKPLLPSMMAVSANLDSLRGELMAAGGRSLNLMGTAGKAGAKVGEGLIEGMVRGVGSLVGADRHLQEKESLRFYRTEEQTAADESEGSSSGLIGFISGTVKTGSSSLAKGLEKGLESLLVSATGGKATTQEEPFKLYRTENELDTNNKGEQTTTEQHEPVVKLRSRDHNRDGPSGGLTFEKKETQIPEQASEGLVSSAFGLVGGSLSYVGGIGRSFLGFGSSSSESKEELKFYRVEDESST